MLHVIPAYISYTSPTCVRHTVAYIPNSWTKRLVLGVSRFTGVIQTW